MESVNYGWPNRANLQVIKIWWLIETVIKISKANIPYMSWKMNGWNLQITQFRNEKVILKSTSIFGFHPLSLLGCNEYILQDTTKTVITFFQLPAPSYTP